nr:T6SS effector amidase Tae4 family protein [uncultured Flavobacterium sp.]
MKTKMKKLFLLFLLSSFFIMTNCQTEEIISNTKNVEDSTQKNKTINIVSLKKIPDVENIVNGIKKEKSVTNKSIISLDLDQEKIIELLRENGDKSYSILIEKTFKDDEPYTVENLNVLSENEDYKALITKWIPSDGKPFYDVEKFIGELQYLDLNGNLLHTLKIGTTIKTAKSNQTAKSQLVIQIGCWSYEMLPCGCSGSNYEIVSSSYTCAGGGGGTTSGGTTSTGGTTGTGGGGYSGSGTTTFVPNIPTQDVVEAKMYKTFLTSLTTDQYNFLGYYQNVDQDIFNYLAENNFMSANKLVAKKMINTAFISDNLGANSSIEFVEWGSNYLIQNPTVTWAKFKNQFMGLSEGQDGTYDAAYWDNPNLTFQKQNLPSWSNFEASFPKDTNPLYDTPEKMYKSIGGTIATFYSGPNTNTCAIRLSKALNYSGVIIPNIPGQTYIGADGKFYFKAAYQINLWMRKTFGTNPATTTTPFNSQHVEYTGAQAGINGINLPSLLNGKKGIYSIYSSNFNWASGHADLLYSNATCGNRCHFYDAPIYRLDIWILN